jgi:serine/threonine protein kinase
MMDEREALVRLQMSSRSLQGLHDAWLQLRGLTLAGRFVLRSLFAAGGESILWTAVDLLHPDTPVLARAALLHWHRPAYLRELDVARARQRIVREAQRLRCLAGTAFPQLIDLVQMPNPLVPREFAGSRMEQEPFLVMELIPGQTVQEWLNEMSRTAMAPTGHRLAVARSVAGMVLDLFITLREKDWLYTDLKPANLLLSQGSAESGIRILDAGSIADVAGSGTGPIAFSPAYVPPDIHACILRATPWWPDERFVLYTLGKTLHQILTARQPVPGIDPPEFASGTPSDFDEPFVALIRSLISGSYPDLHAARAAFANLSPPDSARP